MKTSEVKLSGDGASFGRCSSFFLVSFAILNLKEVCSLTTRNHTLAVVRMLETQELLQTTLRPLLDKIQNLMDTRVIEVGGEAV
ncbi:hypothetical protein EMCRGX_G015733 [Ephydatia muelleri]